MPRKLTTGIKAVPRKNPDGSLRRVDYYDRATGALLGNDRDAAIARALAGRQRPAPPPSSTFSSLVIGYLSSQLFTKLAPNTQKLNRGYADQLRERFGDLSIATITPPVVNALLESYVGQPVKGNRMVSTLRRVLSYGVKVGRVKENAASKPGRLEERPRHQIWSDAQIDRFLEVAPSALRNAVALMLYTAQRPSDVLQMRATDLLERDGRIWIALRQDKTDELIEVPLHRRAVEIIGKPRGILLVPAPRGGRWAYRNFARAWDLIAQRVDAGSADVLEPIRGAVQRRDFRRTGMVKMAEAGATPSQIAAVSGHTIEQTTRILDTYIPRRAAVARGAIEAWEAGQKKGRIVAFGKRHSVVTPNDTTKQAKSPKSLK